MVLPGITFGLLYLWPFLERRATHDHAAHQLLDRPRARPVRTAIGVSTLTFYIVLFAAGSQDIGAQRLAASIPTVTLVLKILLVVLPPLAALLAWKLCRDLTDGDELEAQKDRIRHPLPADGDPSLRAASGPTVEFGRRQPGLLAHLIAVVAVIVRLLRRRSRATAGSRRNGRE